MKTSFGERIFSMSLPSTALVLPLGPFACSAEPNLNLDSGEHVEHSDQALGLPRTASASSVQSSTLSAANAVDGNTGTRWASAFSDPQWLRIDLGAKLAIARVVLRWEAAPLQP